jgi:AcrR family transcriptional regulator
MDFPMAAHSGGDTARLRLPGSMSRPDAWRTRAFIRRIVSIVLAQQGLTGVSLTAIARAIHMPVRTLANHYPTLDLLLAAIAQEHMAELAGAVCRAFDAAGDAPAPARLTAMLLAFLEAVDRDPDVHVAAATATLALPARDRADIALRWESMLTTLAEPLLAVSPGLARRPRVATGLLQMVLGGYAEARPWFTGHDGLDLPARARRLTAMLMAAAGADHEGCCGTPSKACALAWLLAAAGEPPDAESDAIFVADVQA